MSMAVDPADVPVRAMTAVFFAALALRLANILTLSGDPAHFFIEDARLYWDGAAFLLEHGRLDPPPDGAPGRERMPLYFAFLAAVREVFGDTPLAAIAIQSVLDPGTCVLVFKLGAMLGPRVGLLAGAFAATWPNLIVHSAALLTETIFLFLFAAMTLAAARYVESARTAHAAVSGLLCGAALLARPFARAVPPPRHGRRGPGGGGRRAAARRSGNSATRGPGPGQAGTRSPRRSVRGRRAAPRSSPRATPGSGRAWPAGPGRPRPSPRSCGRCRPRRCAPARSRRGRTAGRRAGPDRGWRAACAAAPPSDRWRGA